MMDVICIQECYFVVTSEPGKTSFEVYTSEPLGLPSGRAVYHLMPGDRIVFTEVAAGDTPYDKLLALYAAYFAEGDEVKISAVDN